MNDPTIVCASNYIVNYFTLFLLLEANIVFTMCKVVWYLLSLMIYHDRSKSSSQSSRHSHGSTSWSSSPSRSPSVRRRRGSPSHLDRRRITRYNIFVLMAICVCLYFLLSLFSEHLAKIFIGIYYSITVLVYILFALFVFITCYQFCYIAVYSLAIEFGFR